MATQTEKLHNGNTDLTTKYDFPFQYIKITDVKVEVLEGTPLDWVPKTKDTDYEFHSATEVKFLIAPPAGTNNVRVYRETDSSKLTGNFYPNAAIRSQDLNENFNQNLFLSQETENDSDSALDNSRELNTTTGAWDTAIGVAKAAEIVADAADDKADDAKLATDSLVGTTTDNGVTWTLKGDGQSPNPKGVEFVVNQVDTYVHDGTDPQGGGPAVGEPKGLKYAIDTADAADAVAVDARDTYAIPAKQATDALVGTTTDNGATWTVKGDGLSGNPQGVAYAISTADTAKDTYAIPAKNTADAAKLATDTYVHDGTNLTGGGPADSQPKGVKYAIDQVELYVADSNGLRGDGTDAVTDPQGVKYAVRIAEEASASVAASAIYKVVPDLDTLVTDYPLTGNQPSPPGPDPLNLAPTPDGTYVQITDSTGISLANSTWTSTNSGAIFSDAGSFPSGFSGHGQLTLRVKVSNSTPGSESYAAQEYYANDPESRYGEDRKVIVENDQTIDADYTIQLDKNAHSVGPVTLTHNNTDLLYDPSTYVASNSATAGYTVTIPENSTWLIS